MHNRVKSIKVLSVIGVLAIGLFSACTNPNHSAGAFDAAKVSLKKIKSKAYVVPADSIEPLRPVPAGDPVIVRVNAPTVVQTHTHVRPYAKTNSDTKLILSDIPSHTPGKDTFLVPEKIVIHPIKVAPGLPEVVQVKDAYTKDVNPGNFSSFIKLQGLKHGNVNHIIQDSKGNLWFCTDGGGATRYDGKYFSHFTEESGLTNNVVRCMLQDNNGNLWFGTDEGVTMYDGTSFFHFVPQNNQLLGVTRTIMQDASGNIWFGSDMGVAQYNGKSFTCYNQKQGLVHNRVFSIIQDREENFWFATQGGVSFFDGTSFTNITTQHGLNWPVVRSVLQDNRGRIWLATEEGGAHCLDGKKLITYGTAEGLPTKYLCSVMQDKNGNIWFGTEGAGIACFDEKNFICFSDKQGLSSNTVLCSFHDRGGNIWLGTYGGGVSRYDGKILTHITEHEGLSGSVSRAILRDKKGNIWVGTNGGGVSCYNGKTFIWYGLKQGLTSPVVRSLLEDRDGNIWMGTHGGGVSKFDGEKFHHYGVQQGLGHDVVRCMMQDKSGNIWFGTYGGGVTCYDGKNFTRFTTRQGLSHDVVLHIFQDESGTMWFGTEGGGATRYDGKKFTWYTEANGMSNNEVWSINQDENGVMWFATGGGGISLFDGATFTHVTEKEGLTNNFVFSILKDTKGDFWFGTRFGLNRLNRKNINRLSEMAVGSKPVSYSRHEVFFKSFTHENGFLGIGCFGNSICEDVNGDIWIGANDRVTVYHPYGDQTDTVAPMLSLTGIDLFNENIWWGGLAKQETSIDTSIELGNGVNVSDFYFKGLSKWYSIPANLTLPYNNNFLTFKFIGVTQNQPSRVKYSYKLDGMDEGWSAISNRTEAAYGNLPHGRYTFRIKAMNGEGFWSKEFRYTFSIKPPWWKTLWFRILFASSIILILYVFYRWRTTALRLRQKKLEQTVLTRTAEVVQQKEEADKQRKIVERKQREITDSINYAKRIQEAILPPVKQVKQWLPDSFILYKPKDIVAGDFYFFESTDTHIFLAAADCTGHGVPGAMVSMVCSNALTRCVKEFGITDAGKILDKTREIVIETFEKSTNDVRDGMDISLMVVQKSTRKVQWAGANNPLWMYDPVSKQIQEIASDKQSISKSDTVKPFTAHAFDLAPGSTLYLFTDGFADQFGMSGDEWSRADAQTIIQASLESGKKFKSARMKEMLLSIQRESLQDQRISINQAFEEWRGPLEQIDDVCVIGVRL